ncbi:D-lactate dehydrogenase [Lebetimonas natsushimae]|uniref:D-lactate dehydrogenase n=1 Tax=Lebetimonas natsushimae TaxID=1936991 RepID=A0A292YAM3_9BACT|nr:NAD(P)-dependent oxidoreductase [Lebetimonas natsushimae]GAX87982.1 D-lactate dehydrogenase [Lebetimonas natsushimae]
MKIGFFEIKEEEKEFFEKNLKNYNVELHFYTETVNEINENDFDVISIFINSKIDKNVLDKFQNLKYIQTRSTGYDHIDLVECYKRGIKVSNVRGYAGPAVGEFAYGLLLEAIRKIYAAIERLKKGNTYYKDLKGMEIEGKNIGILGLGTIGLQIAKIAKGFGAKIYGFSRTKKDIYGELGINFCSLEYVLKKSDYLFIALPLTPQTKNLINKNNIKQFRGNVIINPARAEIIQKEVYENFKGIIAADVLPDWNLAKKENIIATPHMAYYTKEALFRIMQISLDNLIDFLNGKTPRFCLKEECKKDYKECK